jgi:hypothetical protein
MSVNSKIREMLARSGEKQQLAEESRTDLAAGGIADTGSKASASASKDTSKSAQVATAGDKTMPKMGSSQDASFTVQDLDDENPGAKAAAPVSKDTSLPTSKGDAKSVKVQAMAEEQNSSETINVEEQLNSIFGENLSEEFKKKATTIFEAAVIARVNHEMEKVMERIEEEAAVHLKEYKEELVEKIDGYLSYVVEQWLEENALAVETGLRTEIAEDFILGMKHLFKEHYIEVPEDSEDVLESLGNRVQELETELDEAIEYNIHATAELDKIKSDFIAEEVSKGLADTQVAKFKKLIEGVEFESEDLYREKLAVIKENYFPSTAKPSPEKSLLEETVNNTNTDLDPVMERYVHSLSRVIKTR